MNNITMGSKYEFKPNRNPPVGGYNTDRGINAISPKSRSAIIREDVYPYRRPKETSPDPGIYDGHLSIFGADVTRRIDMGSKYIFKPDQNPAPGQYNTDSGLNMSKSKSSSAIIREETAKRQILRDVDPGYIYDDSKYNMFG